MVKVGVIFDNFVPGGREQWLIKLAQYCDPKCIQWTGLVLTEHATEFTDAVREVNRYMPVYGPRIPSGSIELHDYQYVKRPKPNETSGIGIVVPQSDVILSVTQYDDLGALINPYRQTHNIKVICVAHTQILHHYATVQDAADYLAAVSEAARNSYRPDTNKHIEVIPNGADVNHCVPIIGRDAFRKKHGLTDQDIVLTYIGRLSKEKNPLAAAKAAAYLGKSFKAMYVGGGPKSRGSNNWDWLPQLERIGSNDSVYVGVQELMGDALAASDVVISCGHFEGSSFSVIETWLAGIPLVTTPVGAIPELELRHGPLAITVPLNPSTEAVASGVIRALSHPNRAVVQRARVVAWNYYTAPAMAANWTNYIEKVASGATLPT